jgi:hypothetical protein
MFHVSKRLEGVGDGPLVRDVDVGLDPRKGSVWPNVLGCEAYLSVPQMYFVGSAVKRDAQSALSHQTHV